MTVWVPDSFKRKCEVCGKEGKIDFHHYKYAYKTSEVRKDPQLALENTIMLCYTHHKIADAMRILDSHLYEVHKIGRVIAKKLKEI